ncbi:MAG TPA: haloacid dehalogenase-like hydrolase [Candidatus Saccharimonadales bacterium]
MKKLLLFDIDGTLLKGLGDDRYSRAISKVHGLDITSNKDIRGSTDYLILAGLLEGEGWGDKQIEVAMPKLLKELDQVHKETFKADNMKLLPGVVALLEALEGKTALGLVTGNLETIAERKLTALGVWSYFAVGGFGSDPHVVRADLVKAAIKKAGYQDSVDLVFVIGDTPNDIVAATVAGVKNSVGVANGFRDTKELEEAGAKIVFVDFKDTKAVLKKLGIN